MRSNLEVGLALGFLIVLYLVLSWNALRQSGRLIPVVIPPPFAYRAQWGEVIQELPHSMRRGSMSETVNQTGMGWIGPVGRVAIFFIGVVALKICWEKRLPVAIISRQEAV